MIRSARGLLVFALIAPVTLLLTQPSATAATTAAASIDCTDRSGTSATTPRLESYQAVKPVRLVDTRDGTGGVDTRVGAGCTLRIDLGDSAVPETADAVGLSVTAITDDPGFLTVFPCASGRPETSNLNTRADFPTPNLVVAGIDADREVCIYARFDADVIVDAVGWWSDGPNRFSSIDPVRAYDTRELPEPMRISPGEVRGIEVGGVHTPADAVSAVVNLTVIDGSGPGYLVAFPCGFDQPLASNLNFMPGEARAVGAIVGLDNAGGMCVSSNVEVHVIVDVTGYYSPAPSFGPSAGVMTEPGTRLADSRTSSNLWSTPFEPGEIRSFDPAEGTTATNATAAILNVIAINTPDPGYVSLFPCGEDVPLVSSVNFIGPGEATNLTTIDRGEDGEICVYSSAEADVIIDRFGIIGPEDGALADRIAFGSRVVFPEYAPGAPDFAIRCNAGSTVVTLTVRPVPGATVRVDGTRVTEESFPVTIPAGGAVTVKIDRDGETTEHRFGCVPTDFPVISVERNAPVPPGWYLTTLGNNDVTPSAEFLAILDEWGAPVWHKRAERDMIDFRRQASGALTYVPLLGQAFGVDPVHGYRVTDLSGALLDEHTTDDPSALPVDHHDYVELAGGGWSLITYPLVQNQDLTALGAGYFADDSIVDGVIQELDPDGTEAWRWSTNDHFEYTDATFPQRFGLYPTEPNGGEVDIWHLNSIDRVADGSGDYVVSARHLDAVFRVDKATGNVDWTLGGNQANAATLPNRLTVVGDPLDGPLRQHDARLVGNVLTMFDNRTATDEPSRAVAYRIDAGAMTATMLWQIEDPEGRSSMGLGSARVTADGTVTVSWGALSPFFNEYAADGTPLFTLRLQPPVSPYRVIKYPGSTFTRSELRNSSGGSVEAPA